MPRRPLLALLVLLVPACGGSDPSPSPSGPVVSGVAAEGAALAGATVTLKDAAGTTRSTTTGASGSFSLSVDGLTAPFLVKVDVPGGATSYFGVSFAPGTANLTPFTDLILEAYYGAQGLDLDAVFAAGGAPSPAPDAEGLGMVEALVENTIALWLQQNGIDPASFSLFSTPFAANGTGIDGLLDDTVISETSGDFTISIDDGTGDQTTTVDVDGAAGTVSQATTTNLPGGTSQSASTTLVPAEGSPLESAIAGARATFEAFMATVNAQGALLADTHLLPYYHSAFVENGMDEAFDAGETAGGRGMTFSGLVVEGVESFDDGSDTLALNLSMQISEGGSTETDHFVTVFRHDGTSWKFYGNQHLGLVSGASTMVRNSTSVSTTDGKHLTVEVKAPAGTLASVTASDAGTTIFNNTAVPKVPGTLLEEYEPTPGGPPVQVQMEIFHLTSPALANFPAPGTILTLTLTPTAGPAQVVTIRTEGTTTELADLTAPTSHLLSAANLGGSLTITWESATSFAVEQMDVVVQLITPSFRQFFDPDEDVFPGDTTATFHLPAQLSDGMTSENVTQVMIGVGQAGGLGQRTRTLWWMP